MSGHPISLFYAYLWIPCYIYYINRCCPSMNGLFWFLSFSWIINEESVNIIYFVRICICQVLISMCTNFGENWTCFSDYLISWIINEKPVNISRRGAFFKNRSTAPCSLILRLAKSTKNREWATFPIWASSMCRTINKTDKREYFNMYIVE